MTAFDESDQLGVPAGSSPGEPAASTGSPGASETSATPPSDPPPLVPWAPPAAAATAMGPGIVLKLWSPGDVGVISFLLGFPAGLTLAARNSLRLGLTLRAGVFLVVGAVALMTVLLLPQEGRGIAGLLNIGIAIYLYWQTGRDRDRAQLSGRPVERAGVPSGLVTAVAGWLLLVPAIVVAIGFPAIGDSTAASTTGARIGATPTAPAAAASPRAQAAAPSTGTPASAAPRISFDTLPSDDPELEAMLPPRVGGRTLERESYRGADLFNGLMGLSDADLAQVTAELKAQGLTIDDVSLAVDGRASSVDPPYFVNALRFRGIKAVELEDRLGLPLGAMLTDSPSAGTFTPVTIGGKQVQRGTVEMIDQTEHARGLPYLYASGDVMFAVVTDDPAWAADAIPQLP